MQNRLRFLALSMGTLVAMGCYEKYSVVDLGQTPDARADSPSAPKSLRTCGFSQNSANRKVVKISAPTPRVHLWAIGDNVHVAIPTISDAGARQTTFYRFAPSAPDVGLPVTAVDYLLVLGSIHFRNGLVDEIRAFGLGFGSNGERQSYRMQPYNTQTGKGPWNPIVNIASAGGSWAQWSSDPMAEATSLTAVGGPDFFFAARGVEKTTARLGVGFASTSTPSGTYTELLPGTIDPKSIPTAAVATLGSGDQRSLYMLEAGRSSRNASLTVCSAATGTKPVCNRPPAQLGGTKNTLGRAIWSNIGGTAANLLLSQEPTGEDSAKLLLGSIPASDLPTLSSDDSRLRSILTTSSTAELPVTSRAKPLQMSEHDHIAAVGPDRSLAGFSFVWADIAGNLLGARYGKGPATGALAADMVIEDVDIDAAETRLTGPQTFHVAWSVAGDAGSVYTVYYDTIVCE